MKRLCSFIALLFAASTVGAEESASQSANELSSKATDPTASLMSFSLLGTYTGGFYGDGRGQPNEASSLSLRSAIPFEFLDHPNLFRLTVPYALSGRGDEGFGAISVFDLFMFSASWGRWGIGPLMNFDTTGDLPDAFIVGPAIGGVWKVNKKLNLGLFSQNQFGSNTTLSQLQPVIAYQLGHGWSISAGDLQFIYDWKASQWLSVPVGFQIGKVTKFGDLPVRLAVNPQYNLIDRAGLNEWSISFSFSALLPSF